MSRELTVLCQYTEFQNQSVKINTEDKHREKCMYTSFFKREPRTNSTLPLHRISKSISGNKHRELHLISDNDPLQACRFGRFATIRRMDNFICDPTSGVSICSIRRMENIMLDLTLCSPSENCISLVTMTPCMFVDSADLFDSANG